MKVKFIFLLLISFIFCKNSFSKDYEREIQELQDQINKLSQEVKNQSNNNNNKLNNFLNGIKISGRLHIDADWYDKNDKLKSYNVNSYNDKFSIRRARFTISKEMNNFLFQFEGNFDKDRTYLGETFIGYNFNEDMMLRFGQIIAPAFMEREKSSNTIATIDSNSFTRIGWLSSYLIGLNFVWKADNFGLSTGIFGNGTNVENKMQDDMNYNFSFRTYYTPIRNEKYVIHLGLDLMYQDYNNDPINNSNDVDVNYYYGLELGLQYKFINFTSEYIKNYYKYDRSRFDGKKFNFDGLSAELIVNFTGEHKIYNKAGYFGGIKVKNPLSKGGAGAFQGVLRYSFANGKDRNGTFVDNIGSHYDYTVGFTWIPEDYIRLLINYSINGVASTNYTYKGKYDAFKIELRMFF